VDAKVTFVKVADIRKEFVSIIEQKRIWNAKE
jgi:hypothetical protein